MKIKTYWKLLTCYMLVMAICVGMLSTRAFALDNGKTNVLLNVEYNQTEARSMLKYINNFRTGRDPDQSPWYWDETNSKKTADGLQELQYDTRLEKIAMQRAAEIALYWSHTRPNGGNVSSAFDEVLSYGVDYTAYGENIGAGYKDAKSTYIALREDEDDYSGQGHRRNMLGSNFNAIGIGCAKVNGRLYWAQEFGHVTKVDNSDQAIDRLKKATVSVDNSNVASKTVVLDDSVMKLSVGDTAPLPKAAVELSLTNAWPKEEKTSVEVAPEWQISGDDRNSITISEGSVTAKSKGKVRLSANIFGEDKELLIEVIDNKKDDVKIPENSDELIALLKTPNTKIRLKEGGFYNLTKAPEQVIIVEENVSLEGNKESSINSRLCMLLKGNAEFNNLNLTFSAGAADVNTVYLNGYRLVLNNVNTESENMLHGKNITTQGFRVNFGAQENKQTPEGSAAGVEITNGQKLGIKSIDAGNYKNHKAEIVLPSDFQSGKGYVDANARFALENCKTCDVTVNNTSKSYFKHNISAAGASINVVLQQGVVWQPQKDNIYLDKLTLSETATLDLTMLSKDEVVLMQSNIESNRGVLKYNSENIPGIYADSITGKLGVELIGSKKVYENKPYFFTKNRDIDADVYFNDSNIHAVYGFAINSVYNDYNVWEAYMRPTRHDDKVVIFNTDGGKPVPSEQIVEYSGKALKPANPIKADHKFLGWYKGDILFDFDIPIVEDITLVAKWQKNPVVPSVVKKYKVVYNTDGAKEPAPIDTNEYRVGDTVIITNLIPKKDGYVFKYWKINPEYQPGAAFLLDDEMAARAEDGSLTFTAVWEKKQDDTPVTPVQPTTPVMPSKPFISTDDGQTNIENPIAKPATKVKTGDDSSLGLWFILLLGTVPALGVTVFVSKRRYAAKK